MLSVSSSVYGCRSFFLACAFLFFFFRISKDIHDTMWMHYTIHMNSSLLLVSATVRKGADDVRSRVLGGSRVVQMYIEHYALQQATIREKNHSRSYADALILCRSRYLFVFIPFFVALCFRFEFGIYLIFKANKENGAKSTNEMCEIGFASHNK